MEIPADNLEFLLPTSLLSRIQHQSVGGSTLLSCFSIFLSIKDLFKPCNHREVLKKPSADLFAGLHSARIC